MSAPAHRAWVALGFGVLAAAAGLYAWVSRSPDVPRASDVDRALGLDHAAVHLHLALRRELHRDPSQAEELRRAPAARPVAERWADRLLDRRVEGAAALVGIVGVAAAWPAVRDVRSGTTGRDLVPVLGAVGRAQLVFGAAYAAGLFIAVA